MPEMEPDGPPEGGEPMNPYAPPEAEIGPGSTLVPGVHERAPFSARRVLAATWEIGRARLPVVLSIFLGPFSIELLYQLLGQWRAESVDLNSPMGLAAQLVFGAAAFVLEAWLSAGQTIALLKVARGQETEPIDVFQGGAYVARFVGAKFLWILGLAVVAAGFLAPAGLVYLQLRSSTDPVFLALFAIGTLAGSIAVAALGVRFAQYPYLIVEREAGVVESLRSSFALTRGHTVELVGLAVIGGLIGVSGLVVFCVGFVFTLPMTFLMLACTYVALTGAIPGEAAVDPDDAHAPGARDSIP